MTKRKLSNGNNGDGKTIGSRLKAARDANGKRQEYLAAIAGVSRTAVTQWEADATEPSFDKTHAIAEALDVDVGYLAFGAGPFRLVKHAVVGETFHERLKHARKRAGLTHDDLAFILGITRTAVTQWEAGITFPSFVRTAVVAALLGVDPRDLVFGPFQ